LFSNCSLYIEDLCTIASANINWNQFKEKSILITGASGLIGTFLIDLLMYRNTQYNNNITVYAVSRNKDKAVFRFKEHFNSNLFHYIQKDIQTPLELDASVDYVIHGASNTHPIAYATEPINTIMLSAVGTNSILDFSSKNSVKRTLFLSSVEIYGENRGDTESFNEDYCGYINCNTLRAGYPESKRVAESLCQAYIKEKNIDIVMARCSRVYGATMGDDDSKAIAQFIKNSINKENIILKSKGDQQYSYCYVADICSALLLLLIKGKNGDAYNISGNDYPLSLFEIAKILCDYSGKEIDFNIPSAIEAEGFSKTTKAILDTSKLCELGWKPQYSLKTGLIRTIKILSDYNKNNNGTEHTI